MSGFWAGAVPPWAFVALVVLVVLVIGGIALGSWYGYGRGWRHAEEEARWAREQAKARRTHPVYRQPPKPDDWPVDPVWDQERSRWLCGYHCDALKGINPDCPMHNDLGWLAHEDQALTLANGQAVTTGEIQAITDEMDAWLAEHVYAAPTDYGAWLEQERSRGLPEL